MEPISYVLKLPGMPSRATLNRWCELGVIKSELRKKKTRLVWYVCVDSLIQYLGESSDNDYQSHYKRWIESQKTGLYRPKPLSEKGIEANTYGVTKYWQYLGLTPTIKGLSLENLARALASVPIDTEARKDHFSQKECIYKGFRSFTQFLAQKTIIEPINIPRGLKPKRVYPARRPIIDQKLGLKGLLEANEVYITNRSGYDISAMKLIIVILFETGMRLGEISSLLITDIVLSQGYIQIRRGKGNTERKVGISQTLKQALLDWQTVRPKTNCKALLVTSEGNPLSKSGISSKFKRFSKATGIDISPHQFRRNFITEKIKKGMPLPLLQKMSGHTNFKTLQIYDHTSDTDAIEWLKNN